MSFRDFDLFRRQVASMFDDFDRDVFGARGFRYPFQRSAFGMDVDPLLDDFMNDDDWMPSASSVWLLNPQHQHQHQHQQRLGRGQEQRRLKGQQQGGKSEEEQKSMQDTAAGSEQQQGQQGQEQGAMTAGGQQGQQLTQQQQGRAGPLGVWRSGLLQPMQLRVDVTEEKDKYLIHADLPGMKKEDVKLSVNNGVLSLEAERKQEKKEEDKDRKFTRVERQYGRVQRQLRLPDDVDAKNVTAKYENGELLVTLPRVEVKKEEPSTINIQ